MNIDIIRFNFGEDFTAGHMVIDGKFECMTMEDAKREQKIDEITCISAGTYAVSLRRESEMQKKYTHKFGGQHTGMIWLMEVDNFEWIYIHIGNTPKDSAGCILVGQTYDARNPGVVGRSTAAYIDLWPKVIGAIEDGDLVTATVHDR